MFKHGMTGLGTLNFFSRLKQTNLTNNIKLLERVGLADVSGQNVKTYSKGMIQRLGLAQALLGSPRILLLDEPTTGLDPVLRHEFYNILSDLKARGVTILLSSHALPELENRVDKLIIMNMGKIVANGSLYELRQKARIPIRIRLKTKNKSTNSMAKKLRLNGSTYVNGKTIEFTCLPEKKMIFLRRASKIGVDLEDLEVELPSLYQLYAYYQNEVRI
jgi:Cu-processing system ATP-binding protein